MKNIANYIKTEFSAIGSYTAGETVADVLSKVHNTSGFGSGELSLGYSATLATDETLTATLKLETSKDGSTWATAITLVDSEVLVDAAEAGTFVGELNTKIDFASRDKYVRFTITPELSADDTDEVDWSYSVVLGSSDTVPV